MALTASTMFPLGTKIPDFQLPDVVTGKMVSVADFSAKKPLLVIFSCCHCPYVRHIQDGLTQLGEDYAHKDVGIVAISSNDALNYPEDSPASLKAMAKKFNYTFPLLYDETQNVAKAYGAACTPDFFLFNSERKLVYRGQMDDSRPGNGKPVTGKDIRAALDAGLERNPIDSNQKPSMGCNIKWKPGNEPSYF